MNRAVAEALFNDQVRHLDGLLLETRKWRVFDRAFPILDIGFEREGQQPMRVRMECDDWNDRPPAITLLSWNGEGLNPLPSGPTGIFHAGPHEVTHRPFICMAGSNEYHTHSSHVGDSWSNYKTQSGYTLGGIIEQVWSAWLKSTP